MRNLYIIGARGLGREVYNLFLKCRKSLGDVECVGFLDDKTDALDGYEGYPPIVSAVEDYEPGPDDVFVCALGDVRYKKLYVEKIKEKGGRFITLVHPGVEIGFNATLGEGCIVRNLCTIGCDVRIGNFVTLFEYSIIGHDTCIGDWSHIGGQVFTGGFSRIGQLATLHPGARLLPHKQVGDGASVGAGSVVIRNVKAGDTVFGMPARVQDLCQEEAQPCGQESCRSDVSDFVASFAETLELGANPDISAETSFRELPEWDSLSFLSVKTMINERYGVDVDDADFKRMNTVGDIARAILASNSARR